MAINFPTSPSNGDLYSAVGRTWQYDSSASAWKSLSESNVTLTGLGVPNHDTLDINSSGQIGDHLIPDTDITRDLGTANNRWRDLYLSGNSIQLGTREITQDNVPDVNLSIAPEVLEIQVDAPDAGQATMWKWTWEQSTLPYARRTITNSNELNVPLYKEGTYVVNNFAAYDIHGSMTQTHSLYLKWVDGAGTDNLVSWATSAGPISDTHPDINGGNATDVQRISVSVPATITLPSLTSPSVSYSVVNNGSGGYTFSGSAKGDNPNLGPFYRGGTYTVNINATGHPFYFTTDNGTNFASGTYFGEYTSGVTGSRTDSGTITFTVPANAPDTLYYQCGNHGVMRGEITVKDLAVETNINGNYVVYFQHTQEGHRTAVELRPIPSLVNQMCLVYDSTSGKFVPQDLATYVENTPSFENKIREVAGTAELVVEDGSAVIAKVNVYDDSTYLPLTGNNPGDQAFATDTDILYIWDGSAWQQAGAANSDDLTEGSTNLFFTNERVDDRVSALIVGGNNITSTYDDTAGTLTIDGQPGYTNSDVATYLSNNGYDTATNIVATITDSAPATLDTLNELAAALGDDPNFATTTANNIALKAPIDNPTFTGTITGNGSGLTNVPSGINRFNYTATAGQTTYAATYTTGAVDVFVNGIKLTRTTDFDDTSGTSIVLTTASVVGEIVEINSYNTYTSADAVSASSGGTFAGPVILDNNATFNNDIIANKHLRLYTTDDQQNQWYIYNHTDDTLRFNYNGAGDDEVVVDTSGNVGIGTSSPARPLTIVNDAGSNPIQSIRNSSLAWSQYALTRYGTEGEDVRYMDFGYYRGSSEPTRGLVIKSQANATLVTFLDSGNVGIGTTSPSVGLELSGTGNASRIKLIDGSAQLNIGLWDGVNYRMEGDANRKVLITSYHTDGVHIGNSGASNLVIKGGKVGIGTTNPLVKLDLGVTSPNDQVIALRQNGVSRTTLGITNNYGVRVAGPSDASGAGSLFEVGQNNASDGTTYQNNRLTVLYDGKVGIGISGPNSLLHVNGGRLHHTDTANSSHGGASSTVYPITDVSIIGGKLRFSIQVFFQNGISNLAIRIYVAQTSLWFAGEVCIGSTYSSQQATGLNRYSFSHNYNSTNNYGNVLTQTETIGQVPAQFQFASHGYDTTEGAHYFEFRHTASTGNTMWLQFEGVGSTPDHANLATWYYKHKTY